MWSVIKNVKFIEVREHLINAFNKITPTTCLKLCEKIRKKEDEYWAIDIKMDALK